jgi:pilus assembly protein CpaB
MNPKRIMIAFVAAVVLAGIFTWLVFKRLRASMGQSSMVKIVAAVNELPAGVALAEKDVELVDWPSSTPITGTFNKIQDVVGHPLIRSLGAKEPIFQRDLGLEGSGVGLATKIPPGMRATAVRSNEIVGVAGFLYPGSHVDVMATISMPNNGGNVTQTVLQDVEVLTAGQTIEPDPQGKPQQVDVVTLLLNPEDSQKLQLASTQGTIQFVLRNGTDKDVNKDLRAARLDQLVPMPKPPAPVVRKKTGKVVAPKLYYVLEVIQGTKKMVNKFDQSGDTGDKEAAKDSGKKEQGTE